MVQLAPRRRFGFTFGLGDTALPKLAEIRWDSSFSPVRIPMEEARSRSVFGLLRSDDEMIIARGRVPRAVLPAFIRSVKKSSDAIDVFSDPPIRPFPICPDSPAVGDASQVARLLNDKEMTRRGMTGEGVAVAVVDTGVNIEHLRKRVQPAHLDTSLSWSWKDGPKPGEAVVSHGTMCAFDALIGAPRATLIDVAVLNPEFDIPQLLSTAVQAYGHLIAQIRGNKLLERYKAVVVTNSWGIYDPADDVVANYIGNPDHAFCVAVRALIRQGADVVFAAGNCGEECPSPHCHGKTASSIYGANSHPDVITVGGVTIDKERVGYSSKGPGRLEVKKPDLCGYTHFSGSGVGDVDSGTSAAAPVVAGFLAAIRTKSPAIGRFSSNAQAAPHRELRSSRQNGTRRRLRLGRSRRKRVRPLY